ncbi:protein NLRC5-like [Leptonychotes weddellii]|uniref:Protein NLRC5-like n=1 Tax=Leptonychotes weddellii TaxID=9713 RepID=A0A7F8Q7M8_LEPWE|nr:protein NLRC5-like [Leptonychotes weddellii]
MGVTDEKEPGEDERGSDKANVGFVLARAPDLQGNAGQRKEAESRSLTLRLQQCQLRVHDVQELIAQLQEGPCLDEVDLSGNQLDDEGCRLMAEAASQLHITRSLDLSDNRLSVDGVPCVLRAVSTCQTLAELHISLSGNALGDEGAAQLAQLLPGLGPLQSLDLSENSLSLDAVFMLTPCFSTLQWLLHLDISSESQHVVLRGDRTGRDQLAGGSLPEFPAGAQFLAFRQPHVPRSLCLRHCQLEPLSLTHLCETLEKCPGPLEVNNYLTIEKPKTSLPHLNQPFSTSSQCCRRSL